MREGEVIYARCTEDGHFMPVHDTNTLAAFDVTCDCGLMELHNASLKIPRKSSCPTFQHHHHESQLGSVYAEPGSWLDCPVPWVAVLSCPRDRCEPHLDQHVTPHRGCIMR